MVEPSHSRVDLSGIHPLKRLTLIVLGFMFGVSLAAAFGCQYIWFNLDLQTGGASCTTFVDAQGLLVSVSWPIRNGFVFEYTSGLQSEDDGEFVRFGRKLAFVTTSFALPGLQMSYVRYDAIEVSFFKIGINHLWLIGLTATLYFFARWRIRRSARIQNQPS